MNKNNITRLVGIDLLRAILIIAGVFYHASLVVAPVSWIYTSPHYDSYAIGLFSEFIHLFRMETFFLLSGFFSTLLIEQKGKVYYIENRKNRILIPSIFLFLLIGIPQYYFLIYDGKFNYDAMISHFWFLQTLIVFIAIHYLYLTKKNYKKHILLSLFLYFLSPPVYYLFSKIEIINLFNSSISQILKYLIYYILGIYLYFNYDELIKKNNFIKITTIAVSTSIILTTLTKTIWDKNGFLLAKTTSIDIILFLEKFTLYDIVTYTLHLINALCISFILIYIFSKINHTSKQIIFIVKSSLCVYILHHPLIIIFGKILDNYNLNLFSYFTLLSTISILIPYFIFYVFRENSFFKKIFGLNSINTQVRNETLESNQEN
ncbi:acyltransferase family protein [Acinetobacter sp. ANC 5380]|uniref:Acyltransferase family protein n=1 Tax=Acinetobacter terrae TaxID=2731247 RepID=A0A7Y2WAS1_9GAMM|nr:acyltransferase family protein [Acinetobacter terrae]NNH76968.1 acyltransferase family protein [Acinetobacter terrae]